MSKNLIEVNNLEKYFEISSGMFGRKKSTVKAPLLPKRYHTQYDGLDNDRHRHRVQETITRWMITL